MGRAYQLGYAKKGSRILFKKMFYNKNIHHLKRKLIKIKKIFAIDDLHNLSPDGGIGLRNSLRSYAS